MNIPVTTKDKPYIEFKIDKKGKVTLSATSNWWGGIKAGFICSSGNEGNTCKPEDLKSYIEAFKKRKIMLLEKEINSLETKLKRIKRWKIQANQNME